MRIRDFSNSVLNGARLVQKKKKNATTKRVQGDEYVRAVPEGESLPLVDSDALEKTFNPELGDDEKFLFDQYVLSLYGKKRKEHSAKIIPKRPIQKRSEKSTQQHQPSAFGRTLTTPSSTLFLRRTPRRRTPKDSTTSTQTALQTPQPAVETSPRAKEDSLLQTHLKSVREISKKVVKEVKKQVRDGSIPDIEYEVTKLSVKFRELHSTRMYLEEQVQHAINQVRANKLPNKWKTEFWDDNTGQKLTLAFLEDKERNGEARIREMKEGVVQTTRQREIYNNILSRTNREKNKLRFDISEIKIQSKSISNKLGHQVDKKVRILEENGRLRVQIKQIQDMFELKKANHEGEIMAKKAEYDAKMEVIRKAIDANKQRFKVCLDAREKAKGILTTKIDIEKIESMKSKSVRGWLKTAKDESRPIMEAVKLIESQTGITNPAEFERQFLSNNNRREQLEVQIQDMEAVIQEKNNSLKMWSDALQKIIDTGITSSVKTADGEVWDLQEKVEFMKTRAFKAEEKHSSSEYLIEEIKYGIQGMMVRLGLRRPEAMVGLRSQASEDRLSRKKNDDSLQAVLDSVDEAAAAKAENEESRTNRKQTYAKMIVMAKEWFDLVTERDSRLSYFVQTKNTRMLEKYSKKIKSLSYSKQGRVTLKHREKVINAIKTYGKPVAMSSNSAMSMLHRVLGQDQKHTPKRTSLKSLMGVKGAQNAFIKKMKRSAPAATPAAHKTNTELYEEFADKIQRDGWCGSPENRRVSPMKYRDKEGIAEGEDPFSAETFHGELKNTVKSSAKSLLHKKLWEAELQHDETNVRILEEAIREQGFKKLRKPKAKKHNRESTLHLSKRSTII